MIANKKVNPSLGDKMFRSKFARILTVLIIVVMSISILRKITRSLQGESLRNEIIEEAAILLLFGHTFLTQSKNEKIISVLQKPPLIILDWVCIFTFTFFMFDSPTNYLLAGLFTVIIISYYFPRWYRRRRNQTPSLASGLES